MNTSTFAEAITNIRDEYVLEYDPVEVKRERYSKKRSNGKKRWLQIAACFVAVFAIVTIVTHTLRKTSHDFKRESFSSYDQFASIITDASLIKHLREANTYELEFFGISDLRNKERYQDEYDSFLVVIPSGGRVIAEITITQNDGEDVIEKTIENHSLYKEICIDSTIVNYSHNVDENYWEALFRSKAENYLIQFYPNSEQELMQMLRTMLSPVGELFYEYGLANMNMG